MTCIPNVKEWEHNHTNGPIRVGGRESDGMFRQGEDKKDFKGKKNKKIDSVEDCWILSFFTSARTPVQNDFGQS